MYIGIDIGGTSIKGVLLSNKKIIAKIKIPTKSKTNKKILVGQIFECIKKLIAGKRRVKVIGIGAAGPVDFKNQKVLNPPNVTALENLYLGRIIEKKFKIKTKIENDANCCGLAEVLLGAGKDKKVVTGLTLGTGVGGFVIINKKIFRGKSLRATEFGHKIKINKNGRKCNCGSKGCLEAYINEKGIRKTAKKIFGREIGTIKLYEMAKKRDKKAIEVWKITGRYLGLGLANIVDTLNPDIIIIGGGIAGAGKFLLNPAKKEMRKNILSPEAKNTLVVRAKLGEFAGAIGAGLLNFIS